MGYAGMSGLVGRSVVMIEDDPVLGRSLVQRLRLAGVATHWARSVAEGEALLRRHRPTLILCDIRLPDGNGEALIARLMPELGGVPVVAMTAYGGVEQAVRLLRAGVDDYLAKPFPVQRLLDKLAAFPARLPTPAEDDGEAGWRSPPMRELRGLLDRLAPAEATILLRGESGVGKGVAARRLHAMAGVRAAAPFTVVDCAALPSTLPEAEAMLFGQENAGAEAQPGLLGRAAGGTLFLDEVAELAPPLQARLLRLVEERVYTPAGAWEPLALAARIVAATNVDLAAHVAAGRFRQDLLFRLSVVEIPVPPLRGRVEDIDDLALHFLQHLTATAGDTLPALTDEARAALQAHAWPGNVRELRNRVERAVLLARGPRLDAADLFPDTPPTPCGVAGDAAIVEPPKPAENPRSLAKARVEAEREHIRRVLAHCGGRLGEAAKVLGVSRTTLWDRMRRLDVQPR